MNCKLKKIIELSGNKASIYSVIIENEQKTLFEIFLEENIISFKSEIENILKRLEIIGKKNWGKSLKRNLTCCADFLKNSQKE